MPVHSQISCQHCSTLFEPDDPEDRFCCGGCAFVFNLINDNGLAQYYTLKGGSIAAPVKNTALQRRDYSWLVEMSGKAEDGAHGAAMLDLAVQGISCTGCVWLIEKLVLRHHGILRGLVRAHPGRLHLEWTPGACDLPQVADELRQFGYLLGPVEAGKEAGNGYTGRMGMCGAFAMNAMAFSLPRYLGMEADFALAGIFTLVAGLSATLAVLTGGSYFISRALQCLRSRVLHMDLPIALGIVAAFAGSLAGWALKVESLIYFDFVAVFTFLMLAGRRLQLAAVERNRGRLLGHTLDANPLRNAAGETVPLEMLAPGTAFQAGPGQIIPVAARLVTGEAAVSMESISGEPEPRMISAGGRLAAGSLNIGRAPLELEAMETWRASLFRRLRESGETAATHPVLDRILRWGISSVLVLAVGGFFAWWAVTGDVARGLQVMISVLVVSCPCALGVAVPLADDLAAARMERTGVFVRRPAFWPRLRRVRKVIFDKTGTLTLENPVLENPEALRALTPGARQALATLTDDSLHPISRSLTESLASLAAGPGLRAGRADSDAEVNETAGQGMWFTDAAGARWTLGRSGWQSPDTGDGATVFACDGVALARFRFRDTPRPDAADEIRTLTEANLSIHILSGDQTPRVRALAASLGIPQSHAHGGLTPEDKERIVRGMDHGDTLYIGDGINDTLAFSAAACTGTPVVDKGLLESKADFYFLGRSLRFLSRLRETARLRATAVRRVAVFAIAYNIAAAGASLAGVMNPLIAAVIMPLSGLVTLAVVAAHFQWRRPVT
jgi:Cu2+-exporting ATPase